MASLAPPISIHFTRKQLAWLDSRRRLGALTRSAALRMAIDELIQQEEGTGRPGGSSRGGEAATAPRQLELTASTTPAAEG
jgi:hypothetical protein